jgi:hypothetical protein
MGLDLVCNNISIKMGSYSSVHRIRQHWIQAYIQVHKNEVQGIEMLEKTIEKEDIDYELFSKVSLDCGNFQALCYFVYHSDSDGIWTWQESAYILTLLNSIKNVLKTIEPENFYDDEKYYLEEILNESWKTESDITFC